MNKLLVTLKPQTKKDQQNKKTNNPGLHVNVEKSNDNKSNSHNDNDNSFEEFANEQFVTKLAKFIDELSLTHPLPDWK